MPQHTSHGLCDRRQGTPLTRRQMLSQTAAGFGSIALNAMIANAHSAASASDTPRPHFPASAKRIIFLFMHGGPSAVDTFDYKPKLQRDSGKALPFDKPRVQFAQTGALLRSPYEFRQYGQSGAWVSSLFPETARHVDDLTFIKSIHGSNEAHGGALLKIHTGSDTFVRPSMGSWISYGLGTENENLPSFITINPTLGHGGVRNFGAAFLPATHQATRVGSRGASMKGATIPNLSQENASRSHQRRELDLIQSLNREELAHSGPNATLEAKIASFELAFRMQTEAPELFDIESEPQSVQRLYGIGSSPTDNFGRQLLLARRLSQSGVRFVQCTHGYWDQHGNLEKRHRELAAEVDHPISGLLTDLKRVGLLEDTLVIWGGEFGRTPTAQGSDGRDHNPHAFTWWMAGGGVRAGYSRGASDDYGYYAISERTHVHDLHATILHLLGLDHERLTFRYNGRDFRLTDVEGVVAQDVISASPFVGKSNSPSSHLNLKA